MIPLPTGKLVIYAVFAVSCGAVGYGIRDTFADRTIAILEAQHATAVAAAEKATREAEAEARRVEKAWRDHVSSREKDHAMEVALRDMRIRELDVSGGRLRDRLANFAKPGSTPGDSCPAAINLQDRIETLRVLVGEVDDLAGESSKAADTLRDELKLCRDYITVLRTP